MSKPKKGDRYIYQAQQTHGTKSLLNKEWGQVNSSDLDVKHLPSPRNERPRNSARIHLSDEKTLKKRFRAKDAKLAKENQKQKFLILLFLASLASLAPLARDRFFAAEGPGVIDRV